MDISQIKSTKSELEGKILKMLKDFEKESQTIISYVSASSNYGEVLPSCGANKNSSKSKKSAKGIYDIKIDIYLGD